MKTAEETRCGSQQIVDSGAPMGRELTTVLRLGCCLLLSGSGLLGQTEVYLSDPAAGLTLRHTQEWGEFGLDTAAARPGSMGSPLRIGEKTFIRGLGHHANGEIVVDLRGQHDVFRASVGVQWQGGGKGSVVFRVVVDGKLAFECGPLSDSDPARELEVSVGGAKELRLAAVDGGDGIGYDMANWAEARLQRDPRAPFFGSTTWSCGTNPAPRISAAVGGFSVLAAGSGPQLAVMEPARMITAGVRDGEEIRLAVPAGNLVGPLRVQASVSLVQGRQAEVEFSLGKLQAVRRLGRAEELELVLESVETVEQSILVMATRGTDGDAGVRWRRLTCVSDGRSLEIPLSFPAAPERYPPALLPNLRPALVQELVEWDWRMQDGIGTPREPQTWSAAIETLLRRGDDLLRDLDGIGASFDSLPREWEQGRAEWKRLSEARMTSDSTWEGLWRRLHGLRRRAVFLNPLADTGPLLFAKQIPGSFSHQLTQYYGRLARPGGGLFMLKQPGTSLDCHPLGTLPTGSVQHPEVSWDGQRILFAFCAADTAPGHWQEPNGRHYHLFEMTRQGTSLRQLTDGPYDDFSPRYLPDGKILFLSTRRGGFHRCGSGPCPVYTLAIANPDGSEPRTVSYHETHEWDPAVLNDGRVVYTRWDYVDRHAVHYQQLWTMRPDGSDARAFYGNNTLNPVGVWEARPVPGSDLVMATAGAHHAMTAGSIILLDVTRGNDGPDPITRLTPDALFPESEFPVAHWHAPIGVPAPPRVPPEERRWPGHCYRTPYPLSEKYFLAAYSFDPLIGEPNANRPNLFGIYLVDRFGNKELLYRDLNLASLWPIPLRSRPAPPIIASVRESESLAEGTFLLQNIYQSWPDLNRDGKNAIQRLRVIQVLPKTTPHANNPRVGLANASPGKQVLGTVPVEPDGSAYFRAPSGLPLSFQALDANGMAVQTMRSLTYLQPGEQAGCLGCHEHRVTAPQTLAGTLASRRPPSRLAPGPDGSRPLSYPILVQPVLDKHCLQCHSQPKPAGDIVLTGAPSGEFTVSYHALAPRVPFSEWTGNPRFTEANSEPLTRPGFFGARASKLMTMLLAGHEKTTLSGEDIERLVTWMDVNALFYGTFDPAGQARQKRGERIAGPALE